MKWFQRFMSKMTELARPKLARPMDPNNMGNDVATLRQLAAELNNPAVTGAKLPEDEPVAVVKKPDPPQVPTPEFRLESRRIMLTGLPASGKSWLAARVGALVFELADPIRAIVKSVFGPVTDEQAGDLYRQLWAWGEGIIGKSVPLTAERMSFVMQFRLRAGNDQFGTPTFWLQSLLARINEQCAATDLVVITDVATSDQYNYLRKAGFTPVHVMCHNLTRNGRGGKPDQNKLVAAIEREITTQISNQPRGAKLWAVWCDDKYGSPSRRFLTIDEFTKGVTK
jgi:hypothetical protein